MVEVRIKIGGEKKTGILSILTQFIFGVFATSMIFAIFLKLWEESGIVFGFATTILLTLLGFYKSESKSFLRRMTWGMALTIIFVTIAYFVLMYVVTSSFDGFNSLDS